MSELPETEISTNILFTNVTGLLERVQTKAGIPKKAEILSGYFQSFAKFRTEFIEKSNADCNSSFYPVLRLIIPRQDRDRDSYGIKIYTLGKLYVRILGIDSNSDVAKRLTGKYTNKEYPDIVYSVMRNRCSSIGNLTVFEVNKHLDIIANCYTNNERKKIDDEIIKMINGMTANDQKWLIRIILKDMYLGIGKAKILSTYHVSGRDFYDQYSSLSRLCQAVENGEVFKMNESIEPFQRVHPMLCLRGTVENLNELITEKEFYLETKMDGERFHIHIKDGEYKYYSRRGYEYHSFGTNATDGSLTPFLQRLFKIPIKNIILDGEMMVWNKEHLMYHTKGENFDVKSIQANNSTLRPCFCAYDILYLNDCSLASKPYVERIRLLATIFNEKPGVLTTCKPIKIRDSNHILECLNKAFDEKEEGVVIKQAESVYAPGKRIASWIKIKPDYIDGLVSDFDLLIIGGYYGRSNKFIYKYLLGIQKKTNTKNEFIAVTNISSGLSLTKRIEISNKLNSHWKVCAHTKVGRSYVTNNPPNMDFGLQTPDVWIEPHNSIILEVKASELVKNSNFGTSHTLRFPRIESVRTDKMWYDCCQFDEYESICLSKSKVEKIVKRHIISTDINVVPPKRSKQLATSAMKTKQFSASSTVGNINLLYKDIQKVDTICQGKDFCVLNTTKNKPIEELQKMIVRHGGSVVQNPSKHTFVCIAGTESLKVKKLKDTGLYNIATVDWLVRAIGADVPLKKLLHFQPSDMLAMKNKNEFQDKYDEYSDSYTKKVTVDELKRIIDSMDDKLLKKLTRFELYELEVELAYPASKPVNIFRLATALFYKSSGKCPKKMELAEHFFQFRGGKVLDSFEECLSHVFVDPDSFEVDQFLRDCSVIKESIKNVRFVAFQWIIECFESGKKCTAKKFQIEI